MLNRKLRESLCTFIPQNTTQKLNTHTQNPIDIHNDLDEPQRNYAE